MLMADSSPPSPAPMVKRKSLPASNGTFQVQFLVEAIEKLPSPLASERRVDHGVHSGFRFASFTRTNLGQYKLASENKSPN